jgi:hypothetical protein
MAARHLLGGEILPVPAPVIAASCDGGGALMTLDPAGPVERVLAALVPPARHRITWVQLQGRKLG